MPIAIGFQPLAPSETLAARAVAAVVIAGAVANAVTPAVMVADGEGLPDFGVSKIVLACAGLGLWRLVQGIASPRLLPALLPAALGSLLRSPDAAWLGLALSMALLLWMAEDRRLRDGASILLAVGLHAPIVSVAGLVAGGDLLEIDTWLAALILSLSGTPVTASATSLSVEGGMDVIMVWRCGVLGNLSVALMMWYSATRFVLGRIPPGTLIVAALVALVMVAVNALRIAGMALDPELFVWLHDGTGATLVRLFALGTIALLTALSLKWFAR